MRDQRRDKIIRLRERFASNGPEGFDATELLELLLSYSSRGGTTERTRRLVASKPSGPFLANLSRSRIILSRLWSLMAE